MLYSYLEKKYGSFIYSCIPEVLNTISWDIAGGLNLSILFYIISMCEVYIRIFFRLQFLMITRNFNKEGQLVLKNEEFLRNKKKNKK